MELEWRAVTFAGGPLVADDETLARLDEQPDEDEVVYVGARGCQKFCV